MSDDNATVVLSVDGVFKKFSRSEDGARKILASQLKNALLNKNPPARKSGASEFWALQDISFKVRRGEVLGVIGFNGAGKSTLLRVLAGLMLPDAGEVRTYGETGALLELGAGMRPNLTGKRNIFVKGALMGKTPAEMEALYPEIAEFTELGDFLSAPLKTYSSGMRLRLGFSIAVHMRPDILLLDEILSVGDYAFKQKCRGMINQMLEKAGVVFVTHSMNDVRQICDRVIVLDRGKILFHGAPQKAIDVYYELANKGAGGLANAKESKINFYGEVFHNDARIFDVSYKWRNADGSVEGLFDTWAPAECRIRFKLKKKPRRLVVGIVIWSMDGLKISALATDMSPEQLFNHNSLEHEIALTLPQLSLNPGKYLSTVAIVDNGEALHRGVMDHFSVVSSQRNDGVYTPAHQWSAIKGSNGDDVDASAPATVRNENV
ncbi:ABC transporter ATP-binding protein [Hyphococcus flavus]|uniref:ABC transporter ATP-binding protein n=1 Tax=Hyphococcus flavus TaxID=1866326 RepID=A0AAE9ZD20_9PROT|nr:ABC transporter ATP-binding protein [Hyphococcus flavus]WDI32479.1 ABC transporter ATP-binding protein [Hyphococcus flavus]